MSKQLEQTVEEFLDLLAELIARRHLQNQHANLESRKEENAADTKSENKNRKIEKNENQ